MPNRHSHHNKETWWSWRIFQNTDTTWESVYLRAIDRKLTLNLIIIFTSFTDSYKYVTKIFCTSYYFLEKIWEYFKVQLSVALSVYIQSIIYLWWMLHRNGHYLKNTKYHVHWKLLRVAIQILHDYRLQWNSYSKSLILNSCTWNKEASSCR